MRLLVLTPKFKRAFRKFVKRNAELQQRIEDTLQQSQKEENHPSSVFPLPSDFVKRCVEWS
jgi:hypothetical protein